MALLSAAGSGKDRSSPVKPEMPADMVELALGDRETDR
jgi:hypothetical protein